MANLGWDEVSLPNPLFEGDTVYFPQRGFWKRRESKSRPNVGIVRVEDYGIQTGRNSGHRIQAHHDDLQTRARSTDCLGNPWPQTRPV